jgi:hypothetical protein
MRCPICQTRPAKRKCPARGDTICAVCCGTKRLVEIRCPSDCGYLASARQHPPAAVQRQQQQDIALLMPVMNELTERQYQFFLLFQSVIARHRGDVLRPLVDADVAEAMASVASTLETASRGVIYERAPAGVNAQELAAEVKRVFGEVTGQMEGPRSPLERDAAKALRAVEEAAKRVGKIAGDEREGFLSLVRRIMKPSPPGARRDEKPAETSGSGLIIVP